MLCKRKRIDNNAEVEGDSAIIAGDISSATLTTTGDITCGGDLDVTGDVGVTGYLQVGTGVDGVEVSIGSADTLNGFRIRDTLIDTYITGTRYQFAQNSAITNLVRQRIQYSNSSALLVEDGGGGDVFVVDTNSDKATLYGDMHVAGFFLDGNASLTGAGAVAITSGICLFAATLVGNACTIANGQVGQRLTVICVSQVGGTDTGIFTPTSMLKYTSFTLGAVGASVQLMYTSGGWAVIGSNNATLTL